MRLCLLSCVFCLLSVCCVQYTTQDCQKNGPDGQCGTPGESGQAGLPGSPGESEPGPAGPAGKQGLPVVYDQGAGCGCPDFKPLQDRLTKLEEAINYLSAQKVGPKFFVSSKKLGSLDAARAYCSERDLDVACPRNEAENNALLDLFPQDYTPMWISCPAGEAADQYSNWGPGDRKTIPDTVCIMVVKGGIWKQAKDCNRNGIAVCQY